MRPVAAVHESPVGTFQTGMTKMAMSGNWGQSRPRCYGPRLPKIDPEQTSPGKYIRGAPTSPSERGICR
jgi:hypothetical protein